MGKLTTHEYVDFIKESVSKVESNNALTLMVGDSTRMQGMRPQITPSSAIFFIEYSELTPEMLLAFNPSLIISPVMCGSFDCLELAKFLEESQYSGQYRISLKKIPNPKIILREVRSQCPLLDFDILPTVTHVSPSYDTVS